MKLYYARFPRTCRAVPGIWLQSHHPRLFCSIPPDPGLEIRTPAVLNLQSAPKRPFCERMSKGNTGDDPINRLVGGGNQGGFRYVGSSQDKILKLCVLYSELTDPDWPDELRAETGAFIYYGDNKRPGHELHDTPRRGNCGGGLLRSAGVGSDGHVDPWEQRRMKRVQYEWPRFSSKSLAGRSEGTGIRTAMPELLDQPRNGSPKSLLTPLPRRR